MKIDTTWYIIAAAAASGFCLLRGHLVAGAICGVLTLAAVAVSTAARRVKIEAGQDD
ncbi:hypothetical protein [Actinomyces sp.]|uniref:hypothetical protein n=1 Tax=Actinomyces sp. TaxID=29317 RepID=UPI001DBACF15|nr:hypothetical protein [Actinomyces sp.]MBS6101007.1 hypothetical protein [Actinomyces sp.]MDU5231092.1 hypothetical protein [Actinomyces sp.]MDU6756594.1 hypothetical protein [Actinomyces sp.]